MPAGKPASLQDRWTVRLHEPVRWMVRPELLAYPAHLHIDLLPGYRRPGLGRALMSAFLGALREHGVAAVHVGYLRTNLAAARFYARGGFTPSDVADPGDAVCVGRGTV